MALLRWQPFREMDSLQRDMNRLFEALAPMEQDQQSSMRQSFMPLAEMQENDDSIHIKIEIPGMNADDLDVQVTKEAVMISGERRSESRSEKNGMTRSEFRYGSFSRTIPLPTRVDNSQVEGNYENGILTLDIPKAEEEKNKVTKVSLGSGKSSSVNSLGSGTNQEFQSANNSPHESQSSSSVNAEPQAVGQ